jgi:hypothetical protein
MFATIHLDRATSSPALQAVISASLHSAIEVRCADRTRPLALTHSCRNSALAA